MCDDSHRGIRHTEVDDDVSARFADNPQRHAYFTDTGDDSGVFAEQRVVGRFERGDDFESRVFERAR
jgi:hypothetical protein